MEHDQVIKLAEVFHLLGDPTRLRIVISCLDESQSVGYIADTLKVSSSLVSHHLRLLKGARLVRAERRGRNVFYVAADDHVRRTLSDMIDHVAESDGEEG